MKYDIQTIENSLYKLLISITNDVSFDDFTIYGICKRGCCCHQLEVSEKGEKSFTVTIPALHRGIYNYQLFVKSISSNTEYLLLQGDVIINERIGDLQSEYKTVLPLAISDKITDVSVSITAAATLSDYEEYINGKYAHCKTVSEVLAVESNYKLDLTSKGQWLYDLTSLTDGDYMFHTCTNLISFSSDLPALTDAFGMFMGCTNLISFEGDLSALTSGSSMFEYCKLDLASVLNIANTINTVSSGTINIGMSSTIQDTPELETALATIRSKGWTVAEQYNQ